MKKILLIVLLLTACGTEFDIVSKERVKCDHYSTPWVDVVFKDSEMITYRDYGKETVFVDIPQLQICEVQTKLIKVAIK